MWKLGGGFNAYQSPSEGYWFSLGASASTDGARAAATRRTIWVFIVDLGCWW